MPNNTTIPAELVEYKGIAVLCEMKLLTDEQKESLVRAATSDHRGEHSLRALITLDNLGLLLPRITEAKTKGLCAAADVEQIKYFITFRYFERFSPGEYVTLPDDLADILEKLDARIADERTGKTTVSLLSEASSESIDGTATPTHRPGKPADAFVLAKDIKLGELRTVLASTNGGRGEYNNPNPAITNDML